MTKSKKLFYGISATVLLIVLAVIIFSFRSSSLHKCGIENCHGLDITCGPNVPKQCTMMYMLGDRCRQYVSCEIIEGRCQLVKKVEFEECKFCVEKCLEDYKNDVVEIHRCESECGR
ncbi:hypothetical protein KAS79_02400 [Candidatus Parcubacteria bacterium]|nr:hypothetical protein [Candidatus Parcubacteria bacterium]